MRGRREASVLTDLLGITSSLADTSHNMLSNVPEQEDDQARNEHANEPQHEEDGPEHRNIR